MGSHLECIDGGKAPVTLTLTQRFLRHVEPIGEGPDACAKWTGVTHKVTGAGIFQVARGHNWASARVAWVIANAEPLVSSQQIEPTCSTGKFCVNGAHWRQVKRLRKRPAHIARYDAAFKATAVEAVRRFGLDAVWQALGVKRETVAAWVRVARKQMNGSAVAAEENTTHE
jgi:hypothetical protein